jgi:hypothetical protein
VRISYRPMVALSESTRSALEASGTNVPTPNSWYTGFAANTHYFRGNLSPIISCSGHFGFPRRSAVGSYAPQMYPAGTDLMTISTLFGGPSIWTSIPVEEIEFDERTGELHLSVGLYPVNEIEVIYNSGFDPRRMPRAVKFACASVVKNFLAKGGTGVRSLSGAGGVNVTMDEKLIDDNIDIYLRNYKTVLAAGAG